MKHRLEAEPLPGIGEIAPGDDLSDEIARAAKQAAVPINSGDVLVVTQKIVSKTEGRLRRLGDIDPSPRALELGHELGKDPRLVQVILDESAEVVRAGRGVLITRTRHGLVCANAGVDQSNMPEPDTVSLLPEDPDTSARTLRAGLSERLGARPAVVITDSFGRAWRIGQTDVAIGCAGLAPLDDLRGECDAHGRELTATIDAVADQVAAVAALVREKSGSDAVVVVRRLERYVTTQDGPGAAAIARPPSQDLFG